MQMHQLDIFKETFRYSSLVMNFLEGMPKKYRFTLGDAMFKSSLEMFRHISYANRTRGEERRRHLDEFLAEYDTSVALVRLANENKVLTIDQVAGLTLLIDSMGKQARAWQKS